VSLVLASACGPSAPGSDGDTGGSTTDVDDDDDGDVDDDTAPDTGAAASTTSVDETAGDESSTGAAVPGCESPGSCDSCMQWERIVEGTSSIWIEHVAIAPDGTIWTIESDDASAPDSLLLRGYDASGEPTVAHAVYDDVDAGRVIVTALEVGDDGTIAMLRTERVGELHYITTLDMRMPDGSPSWTHIIGDDKHSVEGEDVTFVEDEIVVVVGSRNAGLTNTGLAGAYGAGDVVAWELGEEELGVSSGSVVAVATADDDLVLAGYADHGLWLGRVSADGAIVWTMAEVEVGGVGHSAQDVAMSSDGDILVVGWEDPPEPGSSLPWLGRYAPDGSSLLSVAFPIVGPGNHELDSIEVTDDGRIFVAGIRADDPSVDGTWRYAQEVACDGAIAWEWAHVNPSQEYDHANGGGLAWSPRVGLVVGGRDYLGKDDEYRTRGFLALLTP
jgi:hypothetical protein